MRTPEQTIEHPFTIPETDEAELVIGLPFQATPFTISGQTEALVPIATAAYKAAERDEVRQTRNVAAQKLVEATVTVAQPETQYVNLADLNSHQAAHMALKALAYDIKTFGRDNKYNRFMERLHQEQDLKMDMELGLVQRVHCRLHEKMLTEKR
jgi:hypothetical protein